jgi:hypothetical protein
MTHVLEADYVEQTRPYSQKELAYLRSKMYNDLRLGDVKAHHNKCNHFYCVKKHSRKEKDITEQKNEDAGNCSVCWKYNKTPRHLQNRANSLIVDYMKYFENDPKYLTYDNVDLESCFYRWLML